MHTSAIILAGGSGERFGAKKQLVHYVGLPLWWHVYNKCLEADLFKKIVVVGIEAPPVDRTQYTEFIAKGGKTRQESVFYGLHRIGDVNRVVILEAARPLITSEQIRTIAEDPHSSSSFVAPAVETVIYKGEHIDRNECEILQVPQAFDAFQLMTAHMDTWMTNATDDTILMKYRWGIDPHLIPGGQNLYKVTYPHDIKVLEYINDSLNNRG